MAHHNVKISFYCEIFLKDHLNYLLCKFDKNTQVNQHCENWGDLFKGVQKLKKHVEAEHKKGVNGDEGEGGWVWQESGGGVKGWTLVKV